MADTEILIVDTGVANRHSVRNALEYIGCEVTVSQDPEQILSASKLLFPGVGSFSAGMKTITERGLVDPLREAVVERGVPVLGICLGFQMMAETSEEDGFHTGLGWIPGRVSRMAPGGPDIKIPHIGFNSVAFEENSPLFGGLPQGSDFYFLHGYHMEIDAEYVTGRCDYGGEFVAAIRSKNIVGTQFHPEKSQAAGLQLLRNFAAWDPNAC